MISQPLTSLCRVSAIVSLFLAGRAAPVAVMAQGGLDRATPIGPYLGGTLPSRKPRPASGQWTLVNAFPSLVLTDPIQMLPVPGDSRLLVVEKTGRLVVFENHPATTTKTVILDLSAGVSSLEDSGVLGAAFHPQFREAGSPNRDYLYVYYRHTPDPMQKHPGYLRLSRFTWRDAAGSIDPASESILIQQYDRNNWHNGGGLTFGNDGLLYLSIGDEGGIYDAYGSGQKINRGLFSGVLRLDVDQDAARSHPIRRQPLDPAAPPAGWPSSFSRGYFIPNDNPWQSPEGAILEEFWAIGLRSPHRMTLDPATGDLWIGDVGQSHLEEIDLVIRGANYQWPYLEGNRPTYTTKPANLVGEETPPLLQYSRGQGGCVIGGYVYRGEDHADLVGHYLFGDWNLGAIRSLVRAPDGSPIVTDLVTLPRHGPGPRNGIAGFGVDAAGEIHVLSHAGTNQPGAAIFRLDRTEGAVEEPPALLSATGAFEDLATLAPAAGLIPYAPIQALWSDGAEKQRWIAIPNDGRPDSDSERITYSGSGEWSFPPGTVLVKHFGFGARKVETRFLVRGGDGEWFGFTYRWREDQSDAELLPGDSLEETIEIAPGQPVTWHFPSRAECFRCHTPAAGHVLGVKTRHLNGDLPYPATGRTANQLATWNQLGFFSPAIDEATLPTLLTAANLADTSATLERRARSYLDVNCSHCHRPGGPTPAAFDARLSVAPFFQNLIGVPPIRSLGIPGERLIQPGDESLSLLFHRLDTTDPAFAMPPLAKSRVHTEAVALVRDWIRSLDPATAPAGPVTGPGPADHQAPHLTVSPASGSILYGPRQIRLDFSEAVTGITLDDFEAENANISGLSGSGASRIFTLTPTSPGAVSLTLAADRLTDLNGNANETAPAISYEHRIPVELTGLRYDYYETRLARLPDLSVLIPVKSGIADTIDLSPRDRDDDFALRFYGDLLLDQAGEYQFTLESDEGSRLWIDGVLLIDLDGLHAAAERRARITLTGTRHRLDLAYFERGGDQTLRVGITGPGIAADSISPDRLAHRADAGPDGGGTPSIRAHFYPDPTAAIDVHVSGLQPDQRIGRSRQRQHGDGIYNLSAAGQTLRLPRGRGGAGTFFVTLENDRLVTDDPALHCERPGRSHRAAFRLGTRNVTAALLTGRLRPGPLASGKTRTLEASVRALSRAGHRVPDVDLDLTVTSSHPEVPGDRVRATLPALRQRRD